MVHVLFEALIIYPDLATSFNFLLRKLAMTFPFVKRRKYHKGSWPSEYEFHYTDVQCIKVAGKAVYCVWYFCGLYLLALQGFRPCLDA